MILKKCCRQLDPSVSVWKKDFTILRSSLGVIDCIIGSPLSYRSENRHPIDYRNLTLLLYTIITESLKTCQFTFAPSYTKQNHNSIVLNFSLTFSPSLELSGYLFSLNGSPNDSCIPISRLSLSGMVKNSVRTVLALKVIKRSTSGFAQALHLSVIN